MTDISELESKWKFFSFATAAENKDIGDPVCEVTLLEMSNFLDGEQTNRGVSSNYDYVDGKGVSQAGREVTSSSVPATWYCSGDTNRITPPDIRRGEELIIMKFGDAEQLFWTTRNTNKHLRKLETVTYAWSGTQDENDKAVSEFNHYLLEVSTHKGHIVLSTTDKNGEKCRWFIQVRGKDGQFIVADNNNNEIMIDSTQNLIRFINGHDCTVELNKKDFNLTAPGNYNITVQGNATVNVTGAASVKAATYTVDAATITFNGEVVATKGFQVAGSFSGGGNGSFAGFLSLPGGHTKD